MKKGQITDRTGTPLTPSWQGKLCLGNGRQKDFECCCDECDCFLVCYPQYRPHLFERKQYKFKMPDKFKKDKK